MASVVVAAACSSSTVVALVNDVATSLSITVDGAGGPMPAPGDQVQLEVGDSVSLRASATNPLGFTIQPGTVTWTSSDAAVAQISSTGVLRGVGPGTAAIRASSGEVSDAISAVVRDTATASPAPSPAG